MKTSRPTYSVRWDRFTGKYAAVSSTRPGTKVIDTDPMRALGDLQRLLHLLD